MKIRRTCREVTQIVLQGQDRAFTPLERLQLRLHWLACDGCRRFRRQAALMQQASGAWRRYRATADAAGDGPAGGDATGADTQPR